MIKFVESNFDEFHKANIGIPNIIGSENEHVYKSLPEMIE